MGNMGERFQQILKKLEEEEKHRSDLILPLKHVRMKEDGIIETIDGMNLRLGEHGFVQFCQELDMPAKYMKRLMAEKPDFVAQQANYFLQKVDDDTKKRFRLFDDKVQGIVSDRYVPYDDYQLFSNINEVVDRLPYGQIESFYRDEKRTQMKIRFPEITKNLGIAEEDGKKDVVMGGITISNSQIGYSLLKALPLVYRQVCTNGLMGWGEGEGGIKQRHIHFDPSTIGEQLESGIMVAVTNTKALINQMELAREVRVKNPMEEIEKYAKRFNASKKQIEKIQQAYYAEPQANLYGVINAFTRFARDLKSNETQADIELFAGSLLRQVA